MPTIPDKPLVIRDEIHGDMSFDWLLRLVIDHESFQRLRYIKQLGLAEYVFPCATHTRFQHSMGASYLAGRYFKSLLKSWISSPFRSNIEAGQTKLLTLRTKACVAAVAEDVSSVEFWWQVASLAGLLHDVGHGPWSHSFEQLQLRQDFSSIIRRLSGAARDYYDKMSTAQKLLHHEDISGLYIFHIFENLERGGLDGAVAKYFLPIASLVNRKMLALDAAKIENEISESLSHFGIKGGTDFHRLLRPVVSGPFDVDRIDYIQRDGRNCGVQIGGIEWRRIVNKVIPCLAEHQGRAEEPTDFVLISNFKNQHVLDDFIFSLFQMYAQVYMHPKIVGFEELFRQILQTKGKESRSRTVITFELHQTLNDERFREMLRKEFGAEEIDRILFRKPGFGVHVVSYPEDAGMDQKLRAKGFSLIDTHDRPMMKDSVGVFLFASLREDVHGGSKTYQVTPWVSVSPIARQFYSISYSPRIWMRTT